MNDSTNQRSSDDARTQRTTPPADSTTPAHDADARRFSVSGAARLLQKNSLGSLVTSLLVHMLLIIVLALCYFSPAIARQVHRYLVVDVPEDVPLASATMTLGSSMPRIDTLPDLNPEVFDPLGTGVGIQPPEIELLPLPEPPPQLKPSQEWEDMDLSSEESPAVASEDESQQRRPSEAAEIREASDTGAAAGVITNAIQSELAEGDTLVVWLLDASISLTDDRQVIADHLENFYRSIDALNTRKSEHSGSNLLMNAVVAYGATSMEMKKIHRFGGRVCEAMRAMPADLTGIENVMTAIQKSVFYYRGKKRRRDRMMFVVITDESGDDTQLLENTVALCRRAAIAVHVIGPSAVFGAERGSHKWVAKRGFQFLLPVKRGPDTALPERAFLPYWHEGVVPWTRGPVPVQAVPWHGGPYRERVLSGVGPYALTRLALQTGGTFTIMDRAGDGGQFRLDVMREYLPSYESQAEYLAAFKDRPLRQAVSAAAVLSHTEAERFVTPRMGFFGVRSRYFPYPFSFVYMEQTQFQARLKVALQQEHRHVTNMLRVVNVALRPFLQKKVDWEYEYEREESKRWKAWYDLTKGRLLALQVRCLEYNAACKLIPNNLNLATNQLLLHPWGGGLRVKRARATAEEAQRLLERCAEANPGTPWAQLAQWELEKALSIRFEQRVIPPPPPPPVDVGPAPTPQRFSFPNL